MGRVFRLELLPACGLAERADLRAGRVEELVLLGEELLLVFRREVTPAGGQGKSVDTTPGVLPPGRAGRDGRQAGQRRRAVLVFASRLASADRGQDFLDDDLPVGWPAVTASPAAVRAAPGRFPGQLGPPLPYSRVRP
jgi:hypothetical protein